MMLIPAVAFIETAIDVLTRPRNDDEIDAQTREFRALGVERVHVLRTSTRFNHLSGVELGYVIGLETARVLLASGDRCRHADVEL